MKGVDGWGFAELRLIPKAFVDILLLLFQWFEKVQAWPKVFSIWLVILLRKVPTGTLPWSSVRPISVAATLYRVWSKMRTRQLLAHARTLASVTVQPCLSTRSIWGIQVELAAELFVQGKSPCGVVLDLIKAFNVVCRAFLQALMVRLGFPREVVDAWFASMHSLSRQTLIAGAVYGDSSSTTGIPEGDPMSILGMFALCCLFREVVADYSVRALIFSYADNWEIVVDQPESLQDLIVVLDRIAHRVKLPISTLWGRRGKPRKWILLLLAFMCNLLGRSLIGFVTCIGFRVAPQVVLVTFPGLGCFCFGSLTVAVCRLKVDGKWVRVGVDEDAVCCVPSAYALFRTWRRAVSFVLRTGGLVPGNAVGSCSSAVGLGARFPLSGLTCLWLICLFSFLLSARYPRCASPLSGRRV